MLAKHRQQQEEEAQRARILSAKQQREATLMSKAANIQRIRQVSAHHAQARRVGNAATKVRGARPAALVRMPAWALLTHGQVPPWHSGTHSGLYVNTSTWLYCVNACATAATTALHAPQRRCRCCTIAPATSS